LINFTELIGIISSVKLRYFSDYRNFTEEM